MMPKNIAPSEQENFIASFWTMLRECESSAEEHGDVVLKVWVEGWYRQWNRVTGENAEPAWITRAAKSGGTIAP